MADYYIDSSALVKRYVAEAGSAWVRSITDVTAGNTIFISAISEVEVISALTRRLRLQSPTAAASTVAAFRSDLGGLYQIIVAAEPVIARASIVAERHSLRAYDALQLASVLELNADLVAGGLTPANLISSDLELNTAATTEGINVIDPAAQHP